MSSRHPDRMPQWDIALNLSFNRGDASDRSIYNHAPSLVGNATATGRVLTLDGTGDYVTVADAASLDMPSAFSVSCWFEPSTPGAVTRSIAGKYNSTGNNRSWYMVAAYGSGYWQAIVSSTGGTLSGANAVQYHFSASLPTSAWNHIGFVYDGSAGSGQRMKLWINGVQDTSPTVVYDGSGLTPYNNTNALEIGSIAGGSFGWKGKLDDFRLYRRALSAAEVGQIYASGRD